MSARTRRLLLPRTGLTATYNRNDYDQVVVKVKNLDEIAGVKTAIEKQMNRRETIVDVMDTRKAMETIFEAFGQITTFVSAIGGISMIVAGVSILNIMMMSVTERIKEIGIMRSIGAQRKEVMSMFLYEAAILGVVGSIIGGLFSLLGGYAISSLMLQTTKYLFVPSSHDPDRVRHGLWDRRLPHLRYLSGMAGSKPQPDRRAPARVIRISFLFVSGEPFFRGCIIMWYESPVTGIRS